VRGRWRDGFLDECQGLFCKLVAAVLFRFFFIFVDHEFSIANLRFDSSLCFQTSTCDTQLMALKLVAVCAEAHGSAAWPKRKVLFPASPSCRSQILSQRIRSPVYKLWIYLDESGRLGFFGQTGSSIAGLMPVCGVAARHLSGLRT